MSYSDTNPYSSEHESVDLGKKMIDQQNLDKEGLPTSGSDTADATSQSPQAQRHGVEDPYMGVSTEGTFLPEPTKHDDVNDHAWSLQGERYSPKY